MKLIEKEESAEELNNLIQNWIRRDIQPVKIIKLIVSRNNEWILPKEVKLKYPEIQDPSTVMYDLARRGSEEYYIKRPRYYPKEIHLDPILEYHPKKGYRIKPQYYSLIRSIIQANL